MAEPVQEKPSEALSPKRSPVFYLWMLVGIVFFANVGLLFFSGGDADARLEPGQELEEDQKAFDQLSFWEQFLQQHASDGDEVKRSSIDGLEIDPEYEESVVSVMVDNFVNARPQHSGIRSASVVYEALAEGGITRLMLVFPYQEISRVGPVRSARDYFVDFAEEYGGIYVHAGGSPMALEKLYASPWVYDLDEDVRLEGETYSFRDKKYYAPHNLFFDLLLVREWAVEQEWKMPSPRTNWCFSEDDVSGVSVGTLDLNFSNDVTSDSYVRFVYDAEQEHYKRFYGSKGGTPHTDQHDALQVAPTNIVVQVAPSQLIDGDEKERLAMHHIGQGTAYFYRDGKKIAGTWQKASHSSPTQFFDDLGHAVCFHPGQTWVAVVDSEDLIIETPANE